MSNDRDDIQPTALPRCPHCDALADAESDTLSPMPYTATSVADEPEFAAEFAEFFTEPVEDPASEEEKAARLNAVIRRGEEIIAARAKTRREGTAHRAGHADASTDGSDPTATPDQQGTAREVPSPHSVFVTHSRDVTLTGLLIDTALRREFGEKKVFRDRRSIPKGARFTDEIGRTLGKCNILVVIVGRRWASNAEDRRFIDSDSDSVRKHLATAFALGLIVVPVLVDGAALPHRDELPHDIKPLANCQVLPFRTSFEHLDFPHLFEAIRVAAPTDGNERRDGDGTPTGTQETGTFRREEGRV